MKRIATVLILIASLIAFAPLGQAGAAACRPELRSLALSPASVPGGAGTTATVTLTCRAPAAVTVGLAGFKGAATPASVRVARGKASAAAAVRTSVTTVIRHGSITAKLRRTVRKAALTITRTPRTCKVPALSSVSAPALVYVGNRPELTVRLNCAAAALVRVSLSSSTSFLRVPAHVTIARYYKSASITLVPKADEAGQYHASVRATLRSKSLAHAITVDPGLSQFTIPPCSEPDCVYPDLLFTGTVPAGGLTVQLSSNNPAITLPSSQTFPAGSVGGEINFVTVNPVTVNTKVTLSATFGGRTLTAATTLLPPWTTSDSVTLSAGQPGPLYGHQADLDYTALLSNPAGPGGLSVEFSSPSSSIGIEPILVFIPPGDDDATTEVNVGTVTSPVDTTLVATVDGVQASLPLTIEPGLASITGAPATITGGQSFTATVNLAGPVDTATTVELQSDIGILSVPPTVVIPAGQSSATFTATTVAVTSDTNADISAFVGSTDNLVSIEVTVTVTP